MMIADAPSYRKKSDVNKKKISGKERAAQYKARNKK